MDGQSDYEQRARAFMALSDPTRLQIVELLGSGGESSTSEVAERLGISLPLACHHTKLLVDVGLVHKRKEGQSKYVSLNQGLLNALLASLSGRAAR
ncbi:ArsR/SmtB family transcription factor [Gloeobacter morelensis]|uniref:Helix-turn-helix transcriptional regulator n=1 Tax=Gloeobacter morelensis MG652769 TaxID=2781736 RepID=A0ABY3PJC4_9CYAN|nr:metalloregulator ArsR/SmtB family transcription factor [Gloeobacter morelensis]UFP93760.1 helix-turn-helix transcriptional regulator [Gloeobacter morelensis MG652769]